MLYLSGQRLSLEQVEAVAVDGEKVALSPEAFQKMEASRAVIDKIVEEGRVVYGVSTGFGKLANVNIPHGELEELQLNLVRSHACGVGEPLPPAEVRAMMLLRADVLAVGLSGTRPIVAQTVLDMLNAGVYPVIPSRGSVGASGDLAPLAHLALVVIGEGEAYYEGKRISGAEAMKRAKIRPLTLQAKEGLALLNGTQCMGAVGGLALLRARRLAESADVAGAMTLEALLGTPTAFDDRIHQARAHKGQIASAAHLRKLLQDSQIRESHKGNDPRVQDAYSLRCMPQVHGAARDVLAHVKGIVEIETGSATDNPLVFPNEGETLSGGNFHGAPLAMGFDYAAIAVTDLMSISERRIDRLVNPDANEHLPPFLTSHPGTASGFMIPHVVAAALLNEAKVLAHPASVDSVPTSGGQEDHISMGMTAALKFRDIVALSEKVIAIEMLAAAEGLEYRAPLRPGKGVEKAWKLIRKHAARLTKDRSLTKDIELVACEIAQGHFCL